MKTKINKRYMFGIKILSILILLLFTTFVIVSVIRSTNNVQDIIVFEESKEAISEESGGLQSTNKVTYANLIETSFDSEGKSFNENINYSLLIEESLNDIQNTDFNQVKEYERLNNLKVDYMKLDSPKIEYFKDFNSWEELFMSDTLDDYFIEKDEKYMIVNVTSCVNLRSGPSTSYDVVDTLKNYTPVTFLGLIVSEENGTWYKVLSNEQIGFIHGDYVSIYDESIIQNSIKTNSTNTTTTSKEENIPKKEDVLVEETIPPTDNNTEETPSVEETIPTTDSIEDDNVTDVPEETIPSEETTPENSDIDEEDLYWLSVAITMEGGCSWYPEWLRNYIGCVVLNRVECPDLYSDTIYGVLHDPGQYPWAGGWHKEPYEWCVDTARDLLNGNRMLPSDIIYQAGFKQGSYVYEQYYDDVLGSYFYFCGR